MSQIVLRNVRRLKFDPETDAAAMRVTIEHEQARGCQVDDVHEKNLGYDITSLNFSSGELRLIEAEDIKASLLYASQLVEEERAFSVGQK